MVCLADAVQQPSNAEWVALSVRDQERASSAGTLLTCLCIVINARTRSLAVAQAKEREAVKAGKKPF